MVTYEERLHRLLSDPERLNELNRTQLLDSPPEAAFDRLTKLATRLTGAPISLVSLVTSEHQFFKSTNGLPEALADLRTTPLSHSFCQHVIAADAPLIVDDTRTHGVVNTVQSIEDFGILTYMGIPLKTAADHTLGTLCVLGFEPREWEEHEVQSVHDLASIAITEVSLRLELLLQLELHTAIKEREARYRSVVEGIHDVVFKLDKNGHITFANPAWEIVMGYTLESTIGRPIGAFLPQDDVYGNTQTALQAHAASMQSYTTHFVTQDGTMKWLELRVTPQQGEGIAGIITDVTNSYRIEAEREARKQAERHLRLKDALLSNMSHEIRTPLAAIMTCSEILHEEVTPEQREYTKMIRKGGERLLTTLDLMLLYAQAQSNNVKLNGQRFDIVQETKLLLESVEAENVEVILEAPDSQIIESDPMLTGAILKCLIDNAVKFTRQGTITVRVTADDHSLSIQVIDTGIGIPESYMPRLFVPFDQASKGYTRRFEGNGLGLPLVKLLIDKLDGTISVKSKEYEGSEFTVELPLSMCH